MKRLSVKRGTVAIAMIALVSYTPQAYAGNIETVNPTDTISPAGEAESQASQMLGIAPEAKKANQQKRNEPKMNIKVGIGPMWTTSKLYYTESGKYVSNFHGTGFGLSFSHLVGGWYGYGVDFYGSYTSLIATDWKYTTTQLYFGPSFVCGGMLADKLRIETLAGLGLAIHNGDGDDTKAGLGFRFSLGLELMLSKNVGIGIEGMTHRLIYSKPNDFKVNDDEFYGFQQIGFLVGLRYYP